MSGTCNPLRHCHRRAQRERTDVRSVPTWIRIRRRKRVENHSYWTRQLHCYTSAIARYFFKLYFWDHQDLLGCFGFCWCLPDIGKSLILIYFARTALSWTITNPFLGLSWAPSHFQWTCSSLWVQDYKLQFPKEFPWDCEPALWKWLGSNVRSAFLSTFGACHEHLWTAMKSSSSLLRSSPAAPRVIIFAGPAIRSMKSLQQVAGISSEWHWIWEVILWSFADLCCTFWMWLMFIDVIHCDSCLLKSSRFHQLFFSRYKVKGCSVWREADPATLLHRWS